MFHVTHTFIGVQTKKIQVTRGIFHVPLKALHNYYIQCQLKNKVSVYLEQGEGLAATFQLAAFLFSMIAPVKKSVNHSFL